MNSELSITRSVQKHLFIAVLPMLICLVAGVGAGLVHQRQYSAEARLYLGGIDSRVEAIPGLVQASETLASVYSRLVDTPVILVPAAQFVGAPVNQLSGHISASPIDASPIIVIRSATSSSAKSIQYVQGAEVALTQYLARITPNASSDVLDRYQKTSNALAQAQQELQQLQQQLSGRGADTAAITSQIAAKQGEIATDQLQVNTLSSTYSNVLAGESFGMQLVEPATASGDDHRSTIQLYGGIGVALGVIIGVALAVIREARVLRRVDPTAVIDLTSAQSSVDAQPATPVS